MHHRGSLTRRLVWFVLTGLLTALAAPLIVLNLAQVAALHGSDLASGAYDIARIAPWTRNRADWWSGMFTQQTGLLRARVHRDIADRDLIAGRPPRNVANNLAAAVHSEPSSAGKAALLVGEGHALAADSDVEAAIERYRRATIVNPEAGEAWFHLGDWLRLLGQAEEAEATLKKAAADPQTRASAEHLLRAMGR